MLIQRQTLRVQVRDELLNRLRRGSIPPGTGINEAALAAELGVSRTPLREALIALETEGQIESEMGKGFRFAPASIDELAQLAPIIAQLECLALDLTPEDEWDRIAPQLLEWARDFPASVADHREVTMRDADWHELLTSACPNERLLSLLRSLKLAEHRYEYEIVDSGSKIRRHAVEHETIATCLINKDLDGAKDALSSNWINGIWRIIEQTEARSASQGK
ncbi:GntR family transcriptional regulator [Tessaracoccus sp. Z1128]